MRRNIAMRQIRPQWAMRVRTKWKSSREPNGNDRISAIIVQIQAVGPERQTASEAD